MNEEISRRDFAQQIAKAYLGVNALIYGDQLIAKTVNVPTARHVIFLNMSGGMTHIDTFDPKPDNKEVMGETEAICNLFAYVLSSRYPDFLTFCIPAFGLPSGSGPCLLSK